MSDQPTIDINKIVQKYQSIISDLQLQNILLNLRVEDIQQQLTASLASQALAQQPTVIPPNATSPRPVKSKN